MSLSTMEPPKALFTFFLLAKLRCVSCKICHGAANGSARCLRASPSARPPHVSHLTAAFEGLLSGVKGCWMCIAAPADGRRIPDAQSQEEANGRFLCKTVSAFLVWQKGTCPLTMGERGPTPILSLGPLQPACVSNKMPVCC